MCIYIYALKIDDQSLFNLSFLIQNSQNKIKKLILSALIIFMNSFKIQNDSRKKKHSLNLNIQPTYHNSMRKNWHSNKNKPIFIAIRQETQQNSQHGKQQIRHNSLFNLTTSFNKNPVKLQNLTSIRQSKNLKQMKNHQYMNQCVIKNMGGTCQRKQNVHQQQSVDNIHNISVMIKERYQKYLQQLHVSVDSQSNLPVNKFKPKPIKFSEQDSFKYRSCMIDKHQKNKFNQTYNMLTSRTHNEPTGHTDKKKKTAHYKYSNPSTSKIIGSAIDKNNNQNDNRAKTNIKINSNQLGSILHKPSIRQSYTKQLSPQISQKNLVNLSPYRHQADLLRKLRRKSNYQQVEQSVQQYVKKRENNRKCSGLTMQQQQHQHCNKISETNNLLMPHNNNRKPTQGPKIEPW